MSERSKKFLKWIENTHDISFNDRFGIVDLVFEWIDNVENRGCDKTKKIDVSPPYGGNTVHYHERIDKNGRTWYDMHHFCSQPDEARKLKKNDAIIYKKRLGGVNRVEGTGFMIVNSFDFKSDFAARAKIGSLPFRNDDDSVKQLYYGDFAPCGYTFSFATDDEIRDFFDKFFEDKSSLNYAYLLDNVTSDEFKEKYSKYYSCMINEK